MPGLLAYRPWLIATRDEQGDDPARRGLAAGARSAQLRTLAGESVDAFNDVDQPDAVAIETRELTAVDRNDFSVECPAHSVSVLNLE